MLKHQLSGTNGRTQVLSSTSKPHIICQPQRIPPYPPHSTTLLNATSPRSSPTSDSTQRYIAGSLNVEMPIASVQQLPESSQAAVFGGIMAGLAVGTWATCSYIGPLIASSAPTLYELSKATWPLLGAMYLLAGIAHFTAHDAFCTMMPKQGAWGFWGLPGSPSFHVNWTGVAEIAGGAGVLLGTLPPVAEALPWLSPAAAYGLFALTWVVTPSNIYMFTHNAPGPGPAGVPIPPAGHAFRGVMQIVLFSILWGLAQS